MGSHADLEKATHPTVPDGGPATFDQFERAGPQGYSRPSWRPPCRSSRGANSALTLLVPCSKGMQWTLPGVPKTRSWSSSGETPSVLTELRRGRQSTTRQAAKACLVVRWPIRQKELARLIAAVAAKRMAMVTGPARMGSEEDS
jgi:hypothetical protein